MKRIAQFASALAVSVTIALIGAPVANASTDDIHIDIFGLWLNLCDLGAIVSIHLP